MDNQLAIEGYLIKISKGRWATVNNRRFFALRVRGQFLVYYERKPSEMKHIPKKVIPTQTIIRVQRGGSKETKIFYVHMKGHVMKLKANNKEIRDKWVRVLNKALDLQKDSQDFDSRGRHKGKYDRGRFSENSPTKKPRRPGKSAQISRDPGERYTAQAFRSKSRSRQRFGTTDLKLDMSILLKIQTETRSVFETTKSEKERKREHSARALYKRKLMDKILDRDLVYNEEYKKIDIAERNTKFFQCEVAWASQKTGGIAEMFQTRTKHSFSPQKLAICLSKLHAEERRIRNVVSQSYLINSIKIDHLYILRPNETSNADFIREEINPLKIRFLDVIDINQKGFTLVLELIGKKRVLVLFENPLDLDEVVKLVNKAKTNIEELKLSRFPELKFNIDYFEELLQKDIQQKFTFKLKKLMTDVVRVDFSQTRSIVEDLERLEESIEDTKYLLNAFSIKKNLTRTLYFYVGTMMLDNCLRNFEILWNIYVVTMDCDSLSKFLALLDQIAGFFEINDIFFIENKEYIFQKVDKLFFKTIKFDLVKQIKDIVVKEALTPSKNRPENMALDLLSYIDLMLENYKNSNGFLSQRLVLKLLEHIVCVFQDYLLFDKKEEIVRRQMYFSVINNYQIFDKKLPALISKIEIRNSYRAPGDSSSKSGSGQKMRSAGKRSISPSGSYKGDLGSASNRGFSTRPGSSLPASTREVPATRIDKKTRKIAQRAYLDACTKIKVQFFNISNHFFKLYMESLKKVFSRLFKTRKKVSQKEYTLLSQVPDFSKPPELETKRYSDLKNTRILESMIRTVTRVIPDIDPIFTSRLQRFVLKHFTQSMLNCFLTEVRDLNDQRRFKEVDQVFKKLRRDKEQFRRFLKDSDVDLIGQRCLEIMDEIYFVSKSSDEDVVEDLLHLKRISRNYLANRDLELILDVNPNLRKWRLKEKRELLVRLNKNLFMQRINHDSVFKKNLRAISRFVISLKRMNYEDADENEFITVSQIEKTGFKFGVKNEEQESTTNRISCSVSIGEIQNPKSVKRYHNSFLKLKGTDLFMKNTKQKLSLYVVKLSEITQLNFDSKKKIISFVFEGMSVKIFNSEDIKAFYQTIEGNRKTKAQSQNENNLNDFEEKTKNVTVRIEFDEPADNLVYSEIDVDFLAEKRKTILFEKKVN